MSRLFALLFVIALAGLTPAQTHAANQPTLSPIPAIVATYDIYVGGLHFVTSDILFQEQAKKYHSRVQASTYGFWHKLLPWNTLLETDGLIVGDNFQPIKFHNRDVWRDKPKATDLSFDKKGNVTPSFNPPEHDDPEKRDIVTPEQSRGSLDPVTALLQMLAHISVEKNCTTTVRVFDGKRRFDISGIDKGMEDINDDDYGFYKGPARLCNAEFKMIAGEWKDRKPTRFWQKSDTEEGRDPFQIWLAALDPKIPELPVRLETTSVFGVIVVHLSRWHYATADESGLQAP